VKSLRMSGDQERAELAAPRRQQKKAQAGGLAGRSCAAAADATQPQYVLVELLGEFDAMNTIHGDL
jgi:hypothetical protein